MQKRINFKTVFFLMVLLLLGGCGKKTASSEGTDIAYSVYYVNMDETKLVKEPYVMKGTTTEEMLAEFKKALTKVPENVEYRRAVPAEVNLLKFELDNQQVYVYFDSTYSEMSKVQEVLCRAAVVQTLTQITNIEYVTFYVDGQPLIDSDGKPVGIMTGDNFIDNTGEEINSYQKAELKLYFANEKGDKLIAEKTEVVYSSSIAMEKLIVEQLLKGPASTGCYKTIPEDTRILGITVKDGTCYVNLDEGFLNATYGVNEMIPIYSIVNSLTELSTISKVQILINGSTNQKFLEKINFNTVFKRNLDLVETKEESQ